MTVLKGPWIILVNVAENLSGLFVEAIEWNHIFMIECIQTFANHKGRTDCCGDNGNDNEFHFKARSVAE
jgi:hypothetical protein